MCATKYSADTSQPALLTTTDFSNMINATSFFNFNVRFGHLVNPLYRSRPNYHGVVNNIFYHIQNVYNSYKAGRTKVAENDLPEYL